MSNYSSLPASKDDSAPQHGPGGLLATPGMGTRRKAKARWRTKGYDARAGGQIAGNLYRGSDGKFQRGGGASAATPQRGVQLSTQPTPKHPAVSAPKGGRGKKGGGKGRAAAKPKRQAQTPEQKRAARAEQQAQNRADVFKQMNIAPDGQQALEQLRSGEQPDAAALARGGFVEAGLVEQARDGGYRLTAKGRALMSAADAGDAGRAGAAISSSRDQVGARQDRQAEQAQKKRERAADLAQRDQERAEAQKKRQSGGGGSQSTAPKPDRAAERQAEREAKQQAAVEAAGIGQQGLSDLRQAAESGGVQNQQLAALGLLGSDGMTTDQGRRALAALERGDVRGYQAALQDARARMGREQQAAQSKREREARQRAVQDRQIERRAWAHVRPGLRRTNKEQRDQHQNRGQQGDEHQPQQAPEYRIGTIATTQKDRNVVEPIHIPSIRESSEKSFAVFKDASGAYRWIARTTTAYRDRDGEILSVDALDRDSQRMTATKQFGPLRWWHVGAPDPLNVEAPWGPGVDIGDCDYSAVIGRTRVESGTFRDPAIARQMAHIAGDLEMSPGFFHPVDQPGADGVFHAIRTFERSPVPTRYGRASNLFTGFAVKESRMDVNEMERRFKAMITELQLAPEQAQELAAGLVQTEKTAAQQGITYKSDETPASEVSTDVMPGQRFKAANGTEYIKSPSELDPTGAYYAVAATKAAPPPPVAEAAPADVAVETQADDGMGDMEMDDGDADVIGNMAPGEFEALCYQACLRACQEAMAPMAKAFTDMKMSEFKDLLSGMSTKDASRATEIATLKAQIDQHEATLKEAQAKLAELSGDAPAVTLPAEVEAALKSEGPAAPADPTTPTVPDRPWAGAAAGLMPELYRAMEYGPNGWQPKPAN